MTLKEEFTQQTHDYVRKHAAQLESYVAAAEQEDIAKAYQAGAEWACRTMVENPYKWLHLLLEPNMDLEDDEETNTITECFTKNSKDCSICI